MQNKLAVPEFRVPISITLNGLDRHTENNINLNSVLKRTNKSPLQFVTTRTIKIEDQSILPISILHVLL